MPRYEIRKTSDNALTYVEGDWPLNLMLSQAAGTYRARAMSDEQATDIVVPTLTASITQATLTVGDTATLTTNAPAGATYQWRLGGTNISGATSATYVTAAAGTLTCVVTVGPQQATTAGVTVSAAAAWTLDENFGGLANNAPLTGLANWTPLFSNGDGQIQGTGDGRIKTPAISGSSSFPGQAVRYEVDIGAEQEVELDFVDLSAGSSLVNIGAVLRANDTNCYRTTLSNTAGFRVFKGFTWSATLLGAAIPWTPPPMPVTVNFRAITSGSECVIECRVDGTLLGSFTDPAPLTGVRIGLGAATGGGDGLSGPFTATAIRARALT